jgi:hypothetical protein
MRRPGGTFPSGPCLAGAGEVALPRYQFVPISPDGRRGDPVVVAAYDDAAALKRALILPGAAVWDIWRGVSHVGRLAAPVSVPPPSAPMAGPG